MTPRLSFFLNKFTLILILILKRKHFTYSGQAGQPMYISIKTKYCFSIKLEIQEQTETYARI